MSRWIASPFVPGTQWVSFLVEVSADDDPTNGLGVNLTIYVPLYYTRGHHSDIEYWESIAIPVVERFENIRVSVDTVWKEERASKLPCYLVNSEHLPFM